MASYLPRPTGLLSERPIILKRMKRLSHMDFERALWELGTLLLLPRNLYRHVYLQKETKNTWARDDPAVFILICGLLVSSAISWSIVRQSSALFALGLCLRMVLRDFLVIGFLVATIIWFAANTFMVRETQPDAKVEWLYAFDIHTNGFVTIFVWIYVVQLFALPIFSADKWFSLLLGNTLYFIAAVQYFYNIYLGLTALPFLKRANALLLPLLPLSIAYIISLSGYNVSVHALRMYFG